MSLESKEQLANELYQRFNHWADQTKSQEEIVSGLVRLPMDNESANDAASKGDLLALQWLYEQGPNIIPTWHGVQCAIDNNRLLSLKWIYEKSMSLNMSFSVTQRGADVAATYGYLDIVDWFSGLAQPIFPSNNAIMDSVKLIDDDRILRWAHGKGLSVY